MSEENLNNQNEGVLELYSALFNDFKGSIYHMGQNSCLISHEENLLVDEGSIILRVMNRIENQLSEYETAYFLAKQTESKLYLYMDSDERSTIKGFNITEENIIYLTQCNKEFFKLLFPNSDGVTDKDSITYHGKKLEIEKVNGNNYFEIAKQKNSKILLINGNLHDSKSQQLTSIPEGSVLLRTLGRLGNQLFQYAAAYSLAQATESSLYIFVDQDSERDHNLLLNSLVRSLKNQVPDMNYYLDNFNLSKTSKIILIDENTLPMFNSFFYPQSFVCQASKTFTADKVICITSKADFVEVAQKKNDKILVMNNFFEEQGYFDNVSSDILSQYNTEKFNTHSDVVAKWLSSIEEENSVCMNIRRKDMINHIFYLPIDFQEQAMQFIKTQKLVDKPQYYVISDDIPLAKKELAKYNNIEYIEGNTALEGLFLLSKCKNNIQTTSTYNWWSTYLNNNTGFLISTCDSPADYTDLFRSNIMHYKIRFTINGVDQCNNSNVFKSSEISHLLQYKDNDGHNMIKYIDKSGQEVITQYKWGT